MNRYDAFLANLKFVRENHIAILDAKQAGNPAAIHLLNLLEALNESAKYQQTSESEIDTFNQAADQYRFPTQPLQ